MNSNMDIYMENHLYLSAPCFVMDEKKLYFSNRSFNALVIVDREAWNVESMVPFVGEELEAKELHFECHRLGNKIFFLPQGKKKLHIYDVESGEQKAYELEGEYEGPQAVPLRFHVWENKLYLLPFSGGMGLWSYDVNGQLSKESWWEVESGINYFGHGYIDQQHFFSLRLQTREFTITDLENKKTITYQFPDEQVLGVTYDGQDFWYLAYDNADIVRWHPECGVRERYSFPMWDKYGFNGLPYAYIYAAGQEIFVVSGTREELFLLDKKECVLKQVFQAQEFLRIYNFTEKAPVLTRIDDKLIWTFRNVNSAVVIDLKTIEGKMYQDVIPVNEKVRNCFDKILLQNAPLIIEDRDGWDLERFLYYCENSI